MHTMRKYNSEEALLFAWRQKLATIKTNRESLKTELLNILDAETSTYHRLSRFSDKRRELLSEEHQQGWSWTANFNWLWNFLSFISFGRFTINPQPGSRLRDALLTPPEINTELITADASSTEALQLDDLQFETALFSEPQKAFQDFHNRSRQLTNAASPTEKVRVIERLEALKLRLSPHDYHHALTQLFEQAPQECLTYYYALYRKENSFDVLTEHDFIECYLMAETFVRLYISPEKEIPSNIESHPFIFAAQELILILSVLNGNTKIDPIEKMLSEPSFTAAREGVYLEVKEQILTALEQHISSERFNYDSYQTQSKVMEDLYQHIKPKPHPLLMQVTRLIVEVFIRTHYNVIEEKRREWLPGHFNYLTLKFFAEKILGTLPAKFEIDSIEDNNALLAPYNYSSGIHPTYRAAEKHAVAILVSGSFFTGNSLNTARKLCCEHQLSPQEKDWILYRVHSAYPHLIPQLEPLLKRLQIFSSQYLSTWEKASFSGHSPEALIGMIENGIKESQKAPDIDNENKVNTQVLPVFYYLINHCQLNTKQLDVIYNKFLPYFKAHCITGELFQHWQQQIKKHHNELLRFNAKGALFESSELDLLLTENPEIASVLNKDKNPFNRISTLCSKVNLACKGEHIDFAAAQLYARLAVSNFSSLLTDTTKTLTKKEAVTAIELLKDDLKPYVSKEQYVLWYEKLIDLATSRPSNSEIAFFRTTEDSKQSSDIPSEVKSQNHEL
ncbi:hypothetical protein A8135_12400 [Legionella jamestowniensis]|uniref:Substrate of the Dot/Icm secretion system n=2 Tax=Legionella jamestowniensis TaxID=455 RepID=A0ABX2XUR3_9GAMM|nr:hypothetical protein A8135_12400 [Legionella jamestowniensis]